MKAKWGHYPADFYQLKNIAVSYYYWSGTDMSPNLPRSPSDHSVIALDRVRAARSHRQKPKFGLLTGRQRDVLALIVQGRSNKEIARTLGLGEGTVKIHVAALFSKLGIHRRAAVSLAAAEIFGDNEVLGLTA